MGYLSRIGKQSGLRISGQTGQQHGAGTRRRDAMPAALAPIESEETVMVPPPIHTEPVVPIPRSDAVEAKPFIKEVTEAPAMRVTDEIKTTGTDSVGHEIEASPKQDRPERIKEFPDAPTPVVESPRNIPVTAGPFDTLKPEAKPTFQIIEETVFAGAAMPDMLPATEHLDELEAMPDGAAPPAEKKNYFAKTVEIIEGRAADPTEVQTILLREIQEWVAGGQNSEEMPADFTDEPIEKADFVEIENADQPEPGVVRIMGERRVKDRIAEAPEVNNANAGLEEQSFDLSIGTISVVIENESKAPEPVQRARTERAAGGQDTGHRRSRLSRNYI